MVKGLDTFKEYFKDYGQHYIIIGGTACDMTLESAALGYRVTKDIDMILIVEALDRRYAEQFWQFVKDGDYQQREKSEGEREYYRFVEPGKAGFPHQIEIFARKPDVLILDEDVHLTPIPVADEISSLSAILMDDDYYNFTLEHSKEEDGLHLANLEALVVLKAKAFLELTERKEEGKKIDSKDIRKHKSDVFRLALLLTDDQKFDLPPSLRDDLQAFVEQVKDDLPGKEMFKAMGARNIDSERLPHLIINCFGLEA